MNVSQVCNKLSCHIQIYLPPGIILSAGIPDVVFCNISNNVEQTSAKMNVSYICNKNKKFHRSQISYICNTYLVCYIHNTSMTCPMWCYKKIRWYIWNMRTYVTNKLRQRVTRKTFYIQNNCQESKILPFSLLLNFLHPLVLSWNMCSMTCPTWCYKEIHCYICNVHIDVTNKV